MAPAVLFRTPMRILVTGGTGVVGDAAITKLLAGEHAVRLLSRNAGEDARRWPGVEAFTGDVADAQSIRGAADGCDAILHVAGIVAEDPPDVTFESVNVAGTQNMLAEAARAGVREFIYVSSLGADRGTSEYHKSKLEAEGLVRRSGLTWTIVRPGNVYGPGDEVISTILKMVRTLPAIPVIDDGEQEFQPIWHEDLGRILASIAERRDLGGHVLDAAGPEITTMNDLLRRFAGITGRSPIRVPVPMALAQLATRLVSVAVALPVDETKLTMLSEDNVSRAGSALELLAIDATPLDRGLRLLADSLEETLPEEGFGKLEHKRFRADITGSRLSATELMTLFRERVNEFMPIEFVAEPGAAERIEKGATLTGSLPLRGNFQVRVEVAEPAHVVFATIEGHPLAGIVEFTATDMDAGVQFAIDVYARASNVVDWLAVRTVGAPAQDANWRSVIQRIIEASGGSSEGVQQEKEHLEGDDAEKVEKRVREMVMSRKRNEVVGIER